MITYWIKLITGEPARYNCPMCKSLLLLGHSKWLNVIKEILDKSGVSYVWALQGYGINLLWLERTIKQNMKDQFVQEWQYSVFN